MEEIEDVEKLEEEEDVGEVEETEETEEIEEIEEVEKKEDKEEEEEVEEVEEVEPIRSPHKLERCGHGAAQLHHTLSVASYTPSRSRAQPCMLRRLKGSSHILRFLQCLCRHRCVHRLGNIIDHPEVVRN